MSAFLRDGTERRYAIGVLIAAALAVALNWPTTQAGLIGDDFLQLAMLQGSYPLERSAWDLYGFVRTPQELSQLVDGGVLPWWSHPELRLSAFRPLSSLTLWLDWKLGLSPPLRHMHSLVWLAAAIGAYGYLLRRWLATPAVAVLAIWVFAVDPTHVVPTGWIANRGVLITTACGCVALAQYVRFRTTASVRAAALSALWMVLAFAGGENALSIFAYALAWEVIAARDALPARARALLVLALPALAYALLHALLLHGARGSAVYVDPATAPGHFALAVLLRVPALLLSDLLLLPGEILHGATIVAWPLLAVLAIPAAAVVFAFVRAARRLPGDDPRVVASLALGALLGLIPVAGTLPTARLLVVPSLGGALVASVLAYDTLERMRRRQRAILQMVIAILFAALHFLLAPVITHFSARSWRDLHRSHAELFREAPLPDTGSFDKTLVLVNAVDPLALYLPSVRHAQGSPLPRGWRVLSISAQPETLRRIDDKTLELEVRGGAMLTDPSSLLFRPITEPLTAGSEVKLSDLTVTVVETAHGGPTRVRYRFPQGLSADRIELVAFARGKLRRLPVPAVGKSQPIPGGLDALQP